MDSQSGGVLALVSYPGFNNNSFSSGISQTDLEGLLNSKTKPLFNRAIGGVYNPGSTVKPIVAAMALEEKIIDPDLKLETHGFLSIPNPYDANNPSIFVDWKNHGYVNMRDALARSSNVYFYTLGGGYGNIKGLGIEKMGEYFKKFGFDKILSIDLPNEQVGFIPNPENKKDDIWRLGDTYHVSIGQGDLLVTPIRLLTDLNSLINGGKILKPYLVANIKDQDGNVVKEFQPIVLEQSLISLENLEIVKEGMIDTVQSINGTGHILDDLPFTVGGKSGTAQVSSNTKVNALFFSFAPVNNSKISLFVLIENAKEGALNAIPVVKDALLWYYQNRGL
jgi:penicillin-binding protein 2